MESSPESRRRLQAPRLGLGLRLGAAFLLALVIFLPSCASQEYWSFSATRAVYGDSEWDQPHLEPSSTGNDWGLLAFLLLPVAIDLVLLPDTLPRDFLVN